jgi:hypothetical protein
MKGQVYKCTDGKLYYFPTVEDLRIGYEYESKNAAYEDDTQWRKYTIEYREEDGTYTYQLCNEIHMLDDGAFEYRVPVLSREQIEAEGFDFVQTNGMTNWYISKGFAGHVAGGYKIYSAELIHIITPDYNTIKVIADIEGSREVLFEGFCPTINEFRVILKQIGINI